ncbi:MAG: hypothetical protein N2320_02970 [Candidatus Bipolaricaulota bacterium]|nr:hypothetical protein [Candidatus Bipolaricaulota bacterium]
MVEVVVERDEDGRVLAVTLRGDGSPEARVASALVEAPALGLREYLHLQPVVHREGGTLRLQVDRSDFFLDREVDAVMETMVLGLRSLAREGAILLREVGERIRV